MFSFTRRPLLALVCAFGVAGGVLMLACDGENEETRGQVPSTTSDQQTPPQEEGSMVFSLRSDAFGEGEAIPSRFTCDGEDVSPALSWSGVPEGTQAFTLIMDDPDAPVGVFTHWVVFNLPASAQSLPEGIPTSELLDTGGVQGRNDFGRTGYGGPCPPGGTHHYRFFAYALDAALDLDAGASKRELLDAMRNHTLGEVQLTGTYSR